MFNKLILVQNVSLDTLKDFLVLYIILFSGESEMYRRLRDLREDHDLTQKQIAKILSLTNSAYATIERGEHALTADVLVTLSNFYDVSTDYLLGLTDFPVKFALENNLLNFIECENEEIFYLFFDNWIIQNGTFLICGADLNGSPW